MSDSDPNEILQEEKNVQLPAHITLKIEAYSPLSNKSKEKKCVSDILRKERDLHPAHYTLKIESYSSLLEVLDGPTGRYESDAFDAEGYKWKLILYPHGNKTCEGKGHISLYLAIDDSSSFPKDKYWTVCVYLKLFVLNQNTMKYLTIQDAKGPIKYFDKLRTVQGCAQFLPLDEFNDPCNGYLVDDCCAFGAEVFVIQPSSGREETLKIVKAPIDRTYTWSIKNFSKLNDIVQYSNEFTVEGRKWNLQLYPKGDRDYIKGKFLSLYLRLADWESVSPRRKVYAKVKMRVLDHSRIEHAEKSLTQWFGQSSSTTGTSWGWDQFMSLEDINQHYNRYLMDDTLIVEVEFDVISVVKVQP